MFRTCGQPWSQKGYIQSGFRAKPSEEDPCRFSIQYKTEHLWGPVQALFKNLLHSEPLGWVGSDSTKKRKCELDKTLKHWFTSFTSELPHGRNQSDPNPASTYWRLPGRNDHQFRGIGGSSVRIKTFSCYKLWSLMNLLFSNKATFPRKHPRERRGCPQGGLQKEVGALLHRQTSHEEEHRIHDIEALEKTAARCTNQTKCI